MANLNREERERLRNELLGMSYNAAKGRLNALDPKGHLVYWRTNQRVGEWGTRGTRFDLEGLGTRVDLIETIEEKSKKDRISRRKYNLVDVRVEPLPGNSN
jgi:hypothetical protein